MDLWHSLGARCRILGTRGGGMHKKGCSALVLVTVSAPSAEGRLSSINVVYWWYIQLEFRWL